MSDAGCSDNFKSRFLCKQVGVISFVLHNMKVMWSVIVLIPHWQFESSALFTFCIVLRMAQKCKKLSLLEKNHIATLHKASMKGPDIARQTRHPFPTIYGVLNRFKGRKRLESKARTGRPINLLTTRDTVNSDRKRPLHEITAVLHESREETVSSRTVQGKLYEEG